MNKKTFKALRSQFRNIENEAYSNANGDMEKFKSLLRAGEAAFVELNSSLGFHFNWFKKPTARNGIVSMKVCAHLNYPDCAFKEVKFN